jgi:micrococcal nuclease
VLFLALSIYATPYAIDGDTIAVNKERVRLVQINTPEVGECYYWEARAFTRRALEGGLPITLERDNGLDNRDQYGRALRYVVVGGKNLNLELVRQGYAKPMFYNKMKGKYATLITKYARQAKAQGLGLWKC